MRLSRSWLLYFIICLILIATFCYSRKKEEYRQSVKQKAVVIDLIPAQGRRRAQYDYPQFSYRFNDTVYLNADRKAHARSLAIGDSVTIIINKFNPADAVVYNFLRYWISLPHVVVGVLISLFIFLAMRVRNEYRAYRADPEKYRRLR